MVFVSIWNAFNDEWDGKTWNKLRKFCDKNSMHFLRLREWVDLYEQFSRILDAKFENRTCPFDSFHRDNLHIALLSGFLGGVALRDLEKIRGQKLWQNNKQKQFYSAVTDVLRRYMAGRYDFPAMEQTSAEIFENLKGREIDGDMLESIKQLFSTSDFVKFAKHTATDTECEEVIPTAVRFVNATFEQQLDEEKKEGE